MYNVFADFHHNSLYNSLRLLFEERLGGKLYRPVGVEWFEQGFWKIYDHPETVQQYLSLDQRYIPIDGSRQLNQITYDDTKHYELSDPEYDVNQKAITFEQFKDLDIDIVIASIPEHIEPFKRLIREHKPNAKLIHQIGNSWTPVDVDNVMASALVPLDVPNSVIYHQEFDLNIFKPKDAYCTGVHSFINCYPESPEWELFTAVESLTPEMEFRSFGGQCRDGAISGAVNLATAIRSAQFVWHVKPGGDGYGHVLFNAAACGKPLIVKKSYYEGKLGEALMIPGETCINVDGMAPHEIKGAIEFYTDPERYRAMSQNMIARFKEVVDFDREFIDIKAFLERLR